jgi:hypothetical protein
MPHYQLEVEGQPNWGPLERLARLTRHCRALPALRVDEFMYMGCLVAVDRPAIHMYKHIDSRHYLHLDTAGHAFRVTRVLPRLLGLGLIVDCEPIRHLASALVPVLGLDSTTDAPPRPALALRQTSPYCV